MPCKNKNKMCRQTGHTLWDQLNPFVVLGERKRPKNFGEIRDMWRTRAGMRERYCCIIMLLTSMFSDVRGEWVRTGFRAFKYEVQSFFGELVLHDKNCHLTLVFC